MIRGPWLGTPSHARSDRLQRWPQTRLVKWAIGGAGVVFVSAMALHSAGTRTVLTPGPLASHHATLDQTCAACHDDVTDARASLRCERCHDAVGSNRMGHAAHVMLGSRDPQMAATAPGRECASCHREHLGRAQVLKSVDDGECVVCHTNVKSFSSHPEFAVVKAGRTLGGGMRFDHQAHLKRVMDKNGGSCAACHEDTASRDTFQPINFERHCASCHAADLADPTLTTAVGPEWLLGPDDVRAAGFETNASLVPSNRGRVLVSGARHKDPWLLINALRLRTALDPDASAEEQSSLAQRQSYLGGVARTRPLALAPDADLDLATTTLTEEIQRIDQLIAAAQSQTPADAQTLLSQVATIAGQLPGAEAELAGVQQALANLGSVGQGTSPGAGVGASFENRRTELRNLLDALAARAGSPAGSEIADRLTSIRSRLDALAAPSGESPATDSAALSRLAMIDRVLIDLQAVPGAAAGRDFAAVVEASRAARAEAAGGASPAEFERARTELLRLLDAVSAKAGPGQATRIALLRDRVLALRAGMSVDEWQRLKAERTRQLNRLLLEREIRAETWTQSRPALELARSGAASPNDLAAIQSLAEQADMLDYARRTAPVAAPPAELRESLDRLLGRQAGEGSATAKLCLKCHDYDASGVRLAPVRIAESVHERGKFTHKPHLTLTTCSTCHGMATTSRLASDPIVPPVATCQSCHRPSRAKVDCAACHSYHPDALGRLFR